MRFLNYLHASLPVIFILYFGQQLFVPLSFGLMIAILSYPSCKWLEKKKWPRSVAVALMMFLFIFLFSLLLLLLGYELKIFLNDATNLGGKWDSIIRNAENRVQHFTGMDAEKIKNLLGISLDGLGQLFISMITKMISFTAATIFSLILIPVYGALFLYHRESFAKFIVSLFKPERGKQISHIFHNGIISYFNFVKGTFLVYMIVGLLNTAGLLALGIKHAFIFGMITAIMTIIPYAGIIISAALPVSVALLTKDSGWYAVGVIAVFTVVQYLEANIIFPRIVGQQLNLSTWAVLVFMVAGTLLWGIAGMILFIPFASMLKIISDDMDELKSLNILLSRNEK